jgi:hypothetical protein
MQCLLFVFDRYTLCISKEYTLYSIEIQSVYVSNTNTNQYKLSQKAPQPKLGGYLVERPLMVGLSITFQRDSS